MTATYDPLAADEVYVCRLEPRLRGPVQRYVAAALDLWCATTGGMFELTRTADVVVRRRNDGGQEMRVPAGPPSVALSLLEQVRADLAALSPEEFRTQWGMA